MANRNQPHSQDIIDFVRTLPAQAFAKVRQEPNGRYTARLDNGPKTYVSDPCPIPFGGATPAKACEALKKWLLDDLSCGGKAGKQQYQPHFDRYDVLYRQGAAWKEKASRLVAEADFDWLPTAALPRQPKETPGYAGWTNAATFLTNLYMSQDPVLQRRIHELRRAGSLTARSLQAIVKIKFNRHDDERCGFSDGAVRLDTGAAGNIDWQEMVDNWTAELAPQ